MFFHTGSLKVWEFSSGQEIKSFFPDEPKEEEHSVVALHCLAEENQNTEKVFDIECY